MPKLFITGATGYIGGEALYAIVDAHPDLEITAMVRNSDKGAKVAAQYPKIRLVYGDLESDDLLTKESANADIVLHTANCDHVGAANAIVAGLAQKQGKSYLIHTSGTGILAYEDFGESTYGVKRDLVFDDWDGIGKVTSIPDQALHRNVDKIILAAHKLSANIHAAIVCPPCISGPGRGPDNQRSMQVYNMAKAALSRGKGFVVNDGLNKWTHIHVQDLGRAYLALVDSAMEPDGGKATWNNEGYYFTEAGEFVWGDIGREIAKIAYEKKLINSPDIDNVTKEEADKLTPWGAYLWGTNSRCRALRANKLLGWTPKEKSILELLPEIIESEAKTVGKLQTHAQDAAQGRILR